MTAPSRKDVDAMANIMKALNGDKSGVQQQAAAERQAREDAGIIDTSPGVKTEDIKAMENILSAFNSASSNVSKKVATTINESKKTSTGVAVGLFSVEKTDDGYYDIRDNRTNDTLFEGLYISETAFVIAKHLNEGKKINSDEITKVMSTNALFEHYYEDALTHKNAFKKAKQRKDLHKMDVAEARFGRAKDEAARAKKKIKSIYEDINRKF
jgi:hypothetical protein